MKEIPATELRRNMRSVLDDARVNGKPTAVTLYGEVIAYVVPADWVHPEDLGDDEHQGDDDDRELVTAAQSTAAARHDQ